MKFEINELKFKNTINSIEFNKLKKMEKNQGFDEKLYGESFFRKGLINEWEEKLPKEYQKKIKDIFYDEMKELEYLN